MHWPFRKRIGKIKALAMVSGLSRIVYVDDDKDILQVAKLCLENIGGFEVTCVPKSTDAIAMIREVTPDLVLLDVMMPVLDGTALFQRLREDEELCGIPVAFITACGIDGKMDRYLQLGAKGIIAKPFDPFLLCQRVRQLWDASGDHRTVQ